MLWSTSFFKTCVISLLLVVFAITGMLFHRAYTQKNNSSTYDKGAPFTMPKDKVTKVVLENGMTVLVFKNEAAPKVLLQIAYSIGSAVEKAGERGLAHLLEHMIFKGTKVLKEGDIDSISRKYGALFNAFTSKDETSYYFETNKNNWKPFVSILADCMSNARFEKEHLASEVMAVIQELRMMEDKYWRVMLEYASDSQYPSNHPYHFPIIGYKEDLLDITSEKLQTFYKKYYVPSRATLFVVGDVDEKEIIAEVKKQFAPIPAAKAETDVIMPPLHDFMSRSTTIYREINQPKLGFYFKIGGLSSKEATCIKALEFILGHGEGSRLYKRLVDVDMIATGVSVFGYMLRESGTFLILVEPKDGKIEACTQAIKEELANLIAKGARKDELHRLCQTTKREFFEMLERFEEFTSEWIDSYFATGDELAVFDNVNKICALTPNDIKECAKKNLDPFFMSQMQMVAIPEDKKDLWLENKAYQEELEKRILSKHVRTTPLEEPEFVHTLPKPRMLDFSFPKPTQSFELENGLKVILHQDASRPLLSLYLRLRDADFYSEAKDGIALSLLMEMLMEGSKGYSKDDNVEFFESRGISYSFSTAGVGLDMAKDEYENAFKRLIHVLLYPTFPKDAFAKVKENAQDSYERALEEPVAVAFRLLKHNLYKNHPYGWVFQDALKFISKLSVADMDRLHKEFIFPANYVLSISGDFDPKEMQEAITSIFKAWPADKGKSALVIPKRDVAKPENIDCKMLRDQSVLLLGAQSELTIKDPDIIPLKLLNYICWYSLGSRLYQLREQTGLFYNASGAWASGVSNEPGYNYLYAVLTPKTLAPSEKALHEIIDTIGRDGITQDELDVARQLYSKQLIDVATGNSTIARQLCGLEALNLGFDYYDDVLKRVQTMSVDELNAIARKYFTSKGMTRVRVGRV
jgi:zinc protease